MMVKYNFRHRTCWVTARLMCVLKSYVTFVVMNQFTDKHLKASFEVLHDSVLSILKKCAFIYDRLNTEVWEPVPRLVFKCYFAVTDVVGDNIL